MSPTFRGQFICLMDTIIGVTPPPFKVPRLDAYASGTDYIKAVPEPGSVVLMLAGLGALGGRTRRRAG